MADPNALILSVIKSLKNRRPKKGDLAKENFRKLCSMIDGKHKKERIRSFLVYEEEEEEGWEGALEKWKKVLNLNQKTTSSLVVGMAKFWECNEGKIYSFLVEVGTGDRHRHKLLRGGGANLDTDEKHLHGLLVEITDLWEDEEGELNKEMLHSLLLEMLKEGKCSDEMMIRRVSGEEVAAVWKDKHPKLNKEKLHTWVANKVGLCRPNYIAELLFRAVFNIPRSPVTETDHRGVERAKEEFKRILNLIRLKKLGEESSLSDVVELAGQAHLLIQLFDSSPFALFFELIVYYLGCDGETYHYWFDRKFEHIVERLKEIEAAAAALGSRPKRKAAASPTPTPSSLKKKKMTKEDVAIERDKLAAELKTARQELASKDAAIKELSDTFEVKEAGFKGTIDGLQTKVKEYRDENVKLRNTISKLG